MKTIINTLSDRINVRHWQYVAISVLLCFVAVVFFIRCYAHEASGDELIYEYVWEEDDPTDLWSPKHRFERKIASFSDILQTQIKHYKVVNGRSLVHTAEQAFTGHPIVFSSMNTVMFLLLVALVVLYVTKKRGRAIYSLWFVVTAVLLYLFPYQESLWTSVNYGLNYLWPAVLSILVLIVWDSIESGTMQRRFAWLVVPLALVFGWTHEAFVVPVAGGVFLYYCFNFNRYRGQALLLTIPMWISSAVMVFSPGNISRFFGKGNGGGGLFIKLTNGFDNLLHLKVIWLLLLAILVIAIIGRRRELRDFFARNVRLVWVFGVGFAFSMIANTAPYSHSFVELSAMLILLRLLCDYEVFSKKAIQVSALIALCLFIPHQVVLAKDTVTNYKAQHSMVEEYLESPDGIVRAYYPDISPTSEPFIRMWAKDYHSLMLYTQCYGYVHSMCSKPSLFLFEDDYRAVSEPSEFFVDKNKIPGSADVYKGDEGVYMWVNPDSIRADEELVAELYPVGWDHDAQFLVRLKFAMMPDAYPSEEVVRYSEIETRFGKSYMIVPLPLRKIKAINKRRIKDSDK